MNFIYRMHEGFGRGTSVEGFNGITCLQNFLSCIKNRDNLTIFIDNSSDNFYEQVKEIHPNVLKINLGNSKSFLHTVDYAIKNLDINQKVYFVENDYLHRSNIEKYLEDGFNTGADFVSLYDHPDKYREYPDLLSKIFLGKKSYWRTTPSTCMTFATTVKKLIEHYNLIKEACSLPIPEDHKLFTNIQLKGDILVTPMPGRATHLEKNYLSPFVDWIKYKNNI